jgi:hypothetical protein
MPLVNFFDIAQGDPINLKRRIALQEILGCPAESGFLDARTNGGPYLIDKQLVDRLAIQAGGAPPTPLIGKAVVGGGPFDWGDLDPNQSGLLAFFSNVYKRLDVTDNTTWYRWKYGLDGTPHGEASYLTVYNDTDVLPRTRFSDMLLGGFTLAAEASGNLQITFPFANGKYDFWGDPTQTVGAASSLPLVLNTSSQNWEPDADDNDIRIRIDAIATDGTITMKARVEPDAVYGATDFTYLPGNAAVEIIDSNTGLRIGTCAQTPLIKWSEASPTLVATDEFEIPKRRAEWTETLLTDRAIPSVNTRFYLDDELIRVEGGWEVTAEWSTLETLQDVAFEQGGIPRRKGRFNVTINPTREIVDLTLQKALHERAEIPVVIECCSDDIIDPGSTDTPFRVLFVFPSCRLSGEMFGVTPGGEDTEESPTLVAGVPDVSYVFDGITFDSHCHVVVDTGISDTDVGIS